MTYRAIVAVNNPPWRMHSLASGINFTECVRKP